MMFGLPKFGDGIGLHRIERFYAAHGIDMGALARRSIVVTGSNGKGSTARFIAGALAGMGRRVGCFTSPHLFDVRERFLIGEEQIPRAAFDAHAHTVLDFNASLPMNDRMGAFEFLFLLAILWFEREAPDAIVWEAGIGGRYDPVRTVRASVSTLTSIELEHTELLGATEELIAYDKTDALAHGGALILSPAIPPLLADRIASYARLSGKTALVADAPITDARNTPQGAAFMLATPDGGRPVQLRLIGRHQIDNAVTALKAAAVWMGEPAPLDRMIDGVARVTWPGRLEKVASSPDLWIDVGHTPHAVDLVTDAFLDLVPREKTLVVFGVSASKEVARIAAIAARKFDHFILTHAHKAGADPSIFAAAFAGKDATTAPDTVAAARLACQRAQAEGLTVLAIGGMFLAIEVQHAWAGGDPATLDFF
jgi:dihydrofolate synthase/folylpolyglutamate synthase